jgi:hypothetical protein
MALLRKKSWDQLKKVYQTMKDFDIGEETTKGAPVHVDTRDVLDMEFDQSYDRSNEIIGTYGCGNFGEYYGDITNDDKDANLLFIMNPIDRDSIDNYEDFGHMYGFGDWWRFRPANKVQKFDQPDKELFESQQQKKEPKILRFRDFTQKNS